jgi:transcriptional regulator with XRE-family HTH domain
MAQEFSVLQQTIARELRARRTALGLSQEQLALTAGIDRTYISQLERGLINPSLKVLWRLSMVLDTEISSLLGGQ